jgi:hypothetical protein
LAVERRARRRLAERPVERGRVALQDGPRDLAHRRAAFLDQAPAERHLRRAQLGRPPEAHAPSLGRGPTRARPLVDQRPLELGDPGEHGQHHPAGRRGRVGPGLGQRAQAGAALLQQLGDLQQVAGRAGEAVEPGHDDDVALPALVEQAGELGPVAPSPNAVQLGPVTGNGVLRPPAFLGRSPQAKRLK